MRRVIRRNLQKFEKNTLGDASAFSFFGNKMITTGEGGMILFKDKKNYEKAKILRDHGMSKKQDITMLRLALISE